MKKILSLLMMLMVSIGMFATDVTFIAGTDVGSTTNTSADQISKDGVTIASTSAGLAYSEYRFYNGTITITSTVGTITQVVFNCTNDSYAGVLVGSEANVGSLSADGTVITWTGSATEFTIRNTAQTRASQITVTVDDNVTPPDPPTPTITTVSTIEEINELDDNASFQFDGTVIVLAQAGQRLYVQDANHGALIYGDVGVQYSITEKIPAGWKGVKTTYGGLPEVKNPTDFAEANGNQNVEATEVFLNDTQTATNFAKYVIVKNATITIEGQHQSDEVVFDFLNDYLTLFGLNSSDDLPYEISENTTITSNGISITISPSTSSTPNRIWNNPVGQVRMYGGTMTITAPTGYNIVGLSITAPTWGSSNSANSGSFSGKNWSGETNELVITINAKTFFNSIGITLQSASKAPMRSQTTTENIVITTEDGTITGYTKTLNNADKPLELPDDLTKPYHVYGILDSYNGTAQILPLGFEDPDTGVITKVEEVTTKVIKSVKYYDIRGIVSDTPFEGINIKVIEYTDGSKNVVKYVK